MGAYSAGGVGCCLHGIQQCTRAFIHCLSRTRVRVHLLCVKPWETCFSPCFLSTPSLCAWPQGLGFFISALLGRMLLEFALWNTPLTYCWDNSEVCNHFLCTLYEGRLKWWFWSLSPPQKLLEGWVVKMDPCAPPPVSDSPDLGRVRLCISKKFSGDVGS